MPQPNSDDFARRYNNSYAVKYKTPQKDTTMNFFQKLTLAVKVGTAASQLVLKGKDADRALEIGGQVADHTTSIGELIRIIKR